MALRLNFRSLSISQLHRSLSTMAAEATSTATNRQKSRAALNQVIAENNPDRLLQICRAAKLTPEFNLDRLAFSKAIAKLRDQSCSTEMIRGFLHESVTRPDIKTERSVAPFLTLYGQAGLYKDALTLFDEMPQRGLHRTVRSLNALITACWHAGDYDEMKRVFAEFPESYGIVPNTGTYNILLKGLCASGDSSSAFSILSEMKSKGVKPNSTTFVAIMEGLYKEERFEDVERLLVVMEEHGETPGIATYNVRIKSLCKLKMLKEAMALLEELKGEGIEPDHDTCMNLVHGFGKEGDLEVAKGVFKKMVEAGIDPSWKAYHTLVYYLCLGKDFEAAAIFSKDWMARGSAPSFSTLKSLVEGFVGISMENEAKEIIGMLNKKFPANSDKWTELEQLLS